MIGFGRPAIANARNETRMPGDHCARVRVVCRIGWSKRVSRLKCTLSVIIFISVFNRRRQAAFYNQPFAVVNLFRVILVCDSNASENSPRSCR